VNYQPDRFTALADANVLASALKRNMLLSFAEREFYRVRWSSVIMTETARTIEKLLNRKGHPDPSAIAERQCNRMCAAFEDAMVEGFEPLEAAVTDINTKDRHVLAAAIKTSASVIVTDNVKDFPEALCGPFDIQALSADEFFADVISLSPPHTIAVLRAMREDLKNPEVSPDRLITLCEGEAMTKTASIMHDYRANL
jgi:hypothetical protein